MERKLFKDIISHLPKKQFLVLTGARQLGKTTLLKNLQTYCENAHLTSIYFTLEDPSILEDFNIHPENLFKYVPKPNQITSNKTVILIDEIQYLNNPTNFLKYIYDTYNEYLKLVVTGSSAFYIDQHFTDSLAGRKSALTLFPLSFSEFLLFKNELKFINELDIIANQPSYISRFSTDFKRLLEEYLIYGGYPEVILQEKVSDKIELLNELRNSFLKKDILESEVENETKFRNLFKILSQQIGNQINRSELATTLRISEKTVERYLFVLEKCYHIHLVKPFFTNIRKELTKMPKVYLNDLGFRNSLLNNFNSIENREDKGQLLENFQFQILRNKYDLDNIKYWRTADGNEVDFVVETEFGKGFACEVKWSEREYKASKYKKFEGLYPNYPIKLSVFDFDNPEQWILKFI